MQTINLKILPNGFNIQNESIVTIGAGIETQ